jgi:FKBP-type peptidyl-prolyl cis-trans isomerase
MTLCRTMRRRCLAIVSVILSLALGACGASTARVAHPAGGRAAAPAARSSPLDALPPDTTVAMGIDVQALVASPLWGFLAAQLAQSPEFQRVTDLLRQGCQFEVTRDLGSIVAGLDAQLDSRKIVFVVDGDLGEASLVKCMQAVSARDGQTLSAATEHGVTVFTKPDGKHLAVGWATPHTVVVSPLGIEGDISVMAELVAGGPRAAEHAEHAELARAMARMPAHPIAWIAMILTDEMKAKLGLAPPDSPQWFLFSVTMDHANRLVAELHVQLASEDAARNAVVLAEKELAGFLPRLGLDDGGHEVTITSHGADAMVRLQLTMLQLPRVVSALREWQPVTAPKPPSSSPLPDQAPPADVATIPPYADRTASGLASKVLEPGSGQAHPALQDKVRVEFVGWTSDGKVFNSSGKGGNSGLFPLRGVIPGWTEGLQLMVVGEKRRFWIPEELGYAGQRGKPAGMLVFDVKLVEIIPGPRPIPAPADVSAAPADATRETDGLAWKITRKGNGKLKPSPEAYVTFHFTAWTEEGVMVQSSVQSGRSFTIPMSKGLRPWRELMPGMLAGEKRLIWAPAGLAELDGPARGKAVVFELELISFVEPTPAPPDVAAPPRGAARTASGLYSKVVRKGTGREHPGPDATVEVSYSGWTTDGKMFDSSYSRGKPTRFPLRGVIAGWTEGVQLMVVGEKRRFWIPEELAYKGQGGGAPQGTLVFDVELLAIDPPPLPEPAPPR